MTWCYAGKQGIMLALYIQPGAKQTALAGEFDGALKLRLAAPPVEGQANLALHKWLAARLGVPRQALHLHSGPTSRRKIWCLENGYLSVAEVVQRLSAVDDVAAPKAP